MKPCVINYYWIKKMCSGHNIFTVSYNQTQLIECTLGFGSTLIAPVVRILTQRYYSQATVETRVPTTTLVIII